MKMLRPRPDRILQILRLRRRHHKNHPVRRLFQSLQQRVRRLTRQHVCFVQNHHFAPRSRRRVAHQLPQLSYLVDAAVRSRVHLNPVQPTFPRLLLLRLTPQKLTDRYPGSAPSSSSPPTSDVVLPSLRETRPITSLQATPHPITKNTNPNPPARNRRSTPPTHKPSHPTPSINPPAQI